MASVGSNHASQQTNMKLSNRDTAIILAALRLAQKSDTLDALNSMPQMNEDRHYVATFDQVDGLCQRLNFDNDSDVHRCLATLLKMHRDGDVTSDVLQECDEALANDKPEPFEISMMDCISRNPNGE